MSNKTKTGTCHFRTKRHFLIYYRDLSINQQKELISTGAAVIGCPKVDWKGGQTLESDSDGRYWLVN